MSLRDHVKGMSCKIDACARAPGWPPGTTSVWSFLVFWRQRDMVQRFCYSHTWRPPVLRSCENFAGFDLVFARPWYRGGRPWYTAHQRSHPLFGMRLLCQNRPFLIRRRLGVCCLSSAFEDLISLFPSQPRLYSPTFCKHFPQTQFT